MDYERFVDADKNRIAWVSVFERFERCICELEPLAPKVAEKQRRRFYEVAAMPLAAPSAGEEILKDAEGELWLARPLSLTEAINIAKEYSRKSVYEIMEDHRLFALNSD